MLARELQKVQLLLMIGIFPFDTWNSVVFRNWNDLANCLIVLLKLGTKLIEILTEVHINEVLLVLVDRAPRSVFLLFRICNSLLILLLHGLEPRLPGSRVPWGGAQHGRAALLASLNHLVGSRGADEFQFSIRTDQTVAKQLWADVVVREIRRVAMQTAYGTWCSCVRTWSSSLFPALPWRLPLLVQRFFASLTVGRNLEVAWKPTTLLFMDTWIVWSIVCLEFAAWCSLDCHV